MKKRGISPVIATILLVMIVIILAIIIFLWARGFIEEAVTKKGAPADQNCDEISLDVKYINSKLQIINNGRIPVYRMDIKAKSGGSVEIIKKDTNNKDISGVSTGESKIVDIGSGYDNVEVVPVILGETETSKKAYVCKVSFSSE